MDKYLLILWSQHSALPWCCGPFLAYQDLRVISFQEHKHFSLQQRGVMAAMTGLTEWGS